MSSSNLNNPAKSLVLVADVPEGTEHIKRILAGAYDLVMVHNLTAATRLVANVDFDGIVAGIHFDDSRMIELLRAVKADARYAERPFVIVRILPTALQPGVEAQAKQMATVLGAAAYITIGDVEQEANGADIDGIFRQKICASLGKS